LFFLLITILTKESVKQANLTKQIFPRGGLYACHGWPEKNSTGPDRTVQGLCTAVETLLGCQLDVKKSVRIPKSYSTILKYFAEKNNNLMKTIGALHFVKKSQEEGGISSEPNAWNRGIL
jgi:hypothetical protein